MAWLKWVFVAIQYAPQIVNLVADIISHVNGGATKQESTERFDSVKTACTGIMCPADTKGIG